MTNTLSPFPPIPAPRPSYNVAANVMMYRHFILLESLASYGGSHSDPKGLSLFLEPSASDYDLGEAAWMVLRAARFVPPDHLDWSLFERSWTLEEDRAYHARLMKRAGVKTRKALYAGGLMVGMQREDGFISLHTALPHGGNGFRGYKGMPKETLPDTIGNESLGRAIRGITTAALAQDWR